ncbi:hypothetical protein HELRODRAFT_167653 [Helobdella robusta]|uniref:Uncharacterized protein n=1 Tax=Helobdella robusta TaxID=6412 RepID=T1EZM6_HELRO|nr:hypothetical protein HELRODRAFT_167653 [Helobdella robusta]ESO09842.1 hypothetical protein HELRODRAFT_167653 [Helobdella robusta]
MNINASVFHFVSSHYRLQHSFSETDTETEPFSVAQVQGIQTRNKKKCIILKSWSVIRKIMIKNDNDNEDCSELLHQAALFGNAELMESLLLGTSRCSIDNQDSYGRTPLYTTITNNSLKCCHLLLMAGGVYGETMLMRAIFISCNQTEKQKKFYKMVKTALHIASKENKKQFVDLLLEYSAETNIRDDSGRMAIDVAIEHNSTDCVESLQMQLDINLMKKTESEGGRLKS